MTTTHTITATITVPLSALRQLQAAAGQWAGELDRRARRTSDARLQDLSRSQAARIRAASGDVEDALTRADFNEEGEDPCTCAPVAGPHPGCAEFADDRDVPCPSCQAAWEAEREEEAAAARERELYVATFSTTAGRILVQREGPLLDVERFRDGFLATRPPGDRVQAHIELASLDTVAARRDLHNATVAFDAAQHTADSAFRRFLRDPSSGRQSYATRAARELEEATARWDEAADALARCTPDFDHLSARTALLQ